MRKKFNRILTLLFAFVVHISFAQEKTISGTISDEDGMPLPGVNILVKGTTNGTQTDFDGNYSLEAKSGDILTYSFVGYKTVDKTVGASSKISFGMEIDAQAIDEVVVTALGISREKKSLGYATQEVGGEDIAKAKDASFVNALSGKVAGLDIKKSSTMGGSTNVIIRGYSSITGNNQALFVVDGIPLSNQTLNTDTQSTGGAGYDYGNGASDINAEDIESVNVLKGSAATALYGSRAANGAIIITTKKGSKSKGLGISVSSSIVTGKYDKSTFAEYQNEYGQGYGPFYGSGPGNFFLEQDVNGDGVPVLTPNTGEDGSYGAPFDSNLLIYQWNSFYPELPTYRQATPWSPVANDPGSFFKSSFTDMQNVAISNGGDIGSVRFSATRLKQNGILPNSKLGRYTIDLSGTANLSKKLTFTGKATYTNTQGLGRFGTGYDSKNLMTNFRQWWSTSTDIKEQENAYFLNRNNVTWNPSSVTNLSPKYWDNPYWTRYENYNNDERNRIFGYSALNYKMTDWLSILGRVTADTYGEIREERIAIGSVDQSNYTRRNITLGEYNYDLMFNYDKDFSDNFGIAGVVGTNYRETGLNSVTASTNGGLILPRIYALSNSKNPIPFNANSETEYDIRVFGVFASASLDYKNTYFLEGSLRNDTFSTLPEGSNSFSYPAVSASILFSNFFDSKAFTYGKIRASYAEVGNGAEPYRLINTFNPIVGIGGNSIFSNPQLSNNANLKEERTESKELGLELNFFQKRLGLDLSLYEQVSNDLIIPVSVSKASGFESKYVNSAVVSNKGLEAQFYASPFKTKDFEWKTSVNFSTYKSEVVDLFGDSENIQMSSFFGVSINATKGEPYGTIRGTDFVYKDGKKVVGDDGKYLKTSSRREILGDINPDWKAGFTNSFSYKGIDLSFLIDVQKGGSIFSGDTYFGMSTGLHPETAGTNDLGNPLRDPVVGTPGNYDSKSGGLILDGVKEDGTVNDIRADFTTFRNPYGRYGNAPDKEFVYDADYVKLREVSLSYALPNKVIDRLPFNNVRFGVVGRNLWIISKDLPYADPEQSFGAGNVQGVQIGAYPSVKEISFNVNLDF